MLTKLDAIDGECSDVGALQRALRVVLLNCRRANGGTYSVSYRAIHKAADTLGWKEVDEAPKLPRVRPTGVMNDWI